ncbi:MAG: hypothetical protein LBG48_00825 [Rickettsiales bacterium]|jgi:hypothetical protein|nr:hypothetical protein [Rickettsiales bacterium]
MELRDLLGKEQKEIENYLGELFDGVLKRIETKNDEIQDLTKQLEEKINTPRSKVPPLYFGRYFVKYIKNLKQTVDILQFFLKQKIIAKNESQSLVKDDQLEAFKVVINELEYKKDKIKEQAATIEQLQRERDNLSVISDNTQKQNEILQTQNAQSTELLNEKNTEINILREQNKNFELLKVKYSDMENTVFQLRINDEEKNKNILTQANTIENLKQEIKEKNLRIIEIRNIFVEIFDEFNDILQRINQNE